MASEQGKSVISPDMTVGFIGSGRMAQALCKGFVATGKVKSGNILASDKDTKMLEFIQKYGVNTTDDNVEVVKQCDLVCLAVKPHIVEPVLREVKPHVTGKNLFVSIAAGITLNTLEKFLPDKTRVIRVMPNTPALVQSGASVFTRGAHTQAGDSQIVAELLSSIGICEESPEYLLDAVTGLSGSGPAYLGTETDSYVTVEIKPVEIDSEPQSQDSTKIPLQHIKAPSLREEKIAMHVLRAFMAIEALSDGGVKMGLPRDIAIKLAAQTMLGAAKMVLDSGKHPGQLKDDVTSPGGTTIAAVHKLEKNGFRGALIDAVEAATLRARELGQQK